MTGTRVKRWACLAAAAGWILLLALPASGQDGARPAPKSGSEAAKPAADDSTKTEPDATKPDANATAPTDAKASPKAPPEFVQKSDAEWQRILTRLQYAVTRQKATEPPFSGRYATGHFRGNFLCVCCLAAGYESELFSSQHKFESGTGWPSFYRPVANRALRTAPDYSDAEPRVEVMCRRCGAHLGHVFEDGPPPTGLRFCINSLAIQLKTAGGETPTRSASGKATATSKKAKTSAKAKTNPGASGTARKPQTQDSSPATDPDPPAGSNSGQGTAPR
jgi:peptide-methionine (R)-S-oxide reductase